uniref:Uncharacterized protein n=1 Tax=Candidatus Kentrum sp. FW TaxID=2126338 RepID=A0A450TIL7_9GAMM|nr:MAG: hypothetical protein BECKFW1821C_GA0114237_101111 [Candidatus Kentron sp. FW]
MAFLNSNYFSPEKMADANSGLIDNNMAIGMGTLQ